MAAKSKKGSAFERAVCKDLSLWWTGGSSDDVFWRTAGSGGRATTRAKKGSATAGAYGDIGAVDPSGEALLKVVTLELKKGYTKMSPFDMLDKPARAKPQEFEKWIEQAADSASQAKSFAWMIVYCRNHREAMACYPSRLHSVFDDTVKKSLERCGKFCTIQARQKIHLLPFDEFLDCVTSGDIREISRLNAV